MNRAQAEEEGLRKAFSMSLEDLMHVYRENEIDDRFVRSVWSDYKSSGMSESQEFYFRRRGADFFGNWMWQEARNK